MRWRAGDVLWSEHKNHLGARWMALRDYDGGSSAYCRLTHYSYVEVREGSPPGEPLRPTEHYDKDWEVELMGIKPLPTTEYHRDLSAYYEAITEAAE